MIVNETFKLWLKTNTSLGDRSIKDVLSRLKRCENYIELTNQHNEQEAILKLNANDDFKKLTTPVKSQMRRSIKLYKSYIASK